MHHSNNPLTLGSPLRTLDAGGFFLIESAYTAGQALPRHAHEDAYLTIATRGAFEESVGGRRVECGPWDVLVRPAGEAHANVYGRGGARCLLVRVPAARRTRVFEAPGRVGRARAVPIAMCIERELAMRDEASALTIEGLVLELIGEATRGSAAMPRWLSVACEFVRQHGGRIGVGDIARVSGVHSATVARGFREHLRCSPGEYLRRVRIEQAQRELASTAKPIAEIALAAGFYDQSHFTAVFRRLTGVTPAVYRAGFPTARRSS